MEIDPTKTKISSTNPRFHIVFYPLPGDYDPMLQPELIWPGDIFIADLHGSTAPINP